MDERLKEPDIDETIDLQAVFSRLLARRWWVLACVVVSTAAFSAAAFLTRPVYSATTVLAAADLDSDDNLLNFSSSALGGVARSLGIGPRNPRTEEAMAVLRSREFTEKFIVDKKLLPELFPRKWNSQKGVWSVAKDHEPTLAQAYKYFNEKIRTISQDRQTGLITMRIEWTNRIEGAEWANDLVRRLNDEMRARAMAEADASLQFLNKELQSSSTIEVRDAIGRLMESQVKQRMLAHVTQDYALTVVERAIASDNADPVKPRKPLLLALGPVVGLCVGGMLFGVFGAAPSKKRAVVT